MIDQECLPAISEQYGSIAKSLTPSDIFALACNTDVSFQSALDVAILKMVTDDHNAHHEEGGWTTTSFNEELGSTTTELIHAICELEANLWLHADWRSLPPMDADELAAFFSANPHEKFWISIDPETLVMCAITQAEEVITTENWSHWFNANVLER